jgi:PII-like signaling protein
MVQAQIFIDADELIGSKLLYEYILELLIKQKVKGATVFRGRSGFGANQYLKRPNDFFSFDETPYQIVFIDEEEKVHAALTELRQHYKGGFIVTNKVDIWK